MSLVGRDLLCQPCVPYQVVKVEDARLDARVRLAQLLDIINGASFVSRVVMDNDAGISL